MPLTLLEDLMFVREGTAVGPEGLKVVALATG